LSQLKYQNLSSQALDIIFQALILSKITYALPSFEQHISSSDKNRINKFLRKAYRRGLVSVLFDIDTLIHKFDHQLFRSVQYPHHCLHHLLPEKRTINYSWQLRPRGHYYTLCHIHSTTFKNAFLSRCLFASIKCCYSVLCIVYSLRTFTVLRCFYVFVIFIGLVCFIIIFFMLLCKTCAIDMSSLKTT